MNVYVWENKSTIEDIGQGSTYWKRLTLDVQISLYIRGAKQLGHDVAGVIYNVLRKPQHEPMMATPVELRKYTKPTKAEPVSRIYANQRETDENPEEYGKRVLQAIVAEPGRYFQRGVPVRLEDELKEADADVWQVAGNMRDARRLKIYPKNPDACMQWSRACEYLPVCTREQAIDDPFLFRKASERNEELDKAPDIQGRQILTQSAIRCFRSCQRKYYYRYELLARPLKRPEVFKIGKSIHRALEGHMRSGGDLEAAVAELDKDDSYQFAKESAMIHAYHAYWPKPTGVLGVEQQWWTPLINPETGAESRTFVLSGRFDGLVEGEKSQWGLP